MDQYLSTIYVDMDGVIADFDAMIEKRGIDGKKLKMIRGIYEQLSPITGAQSTIQVLKEMGYRIHIATKIPDDNPYAATEKLLWLSKYFPELLPDVTITNDKGSLGNVNDFIIDDRIHKANVSNFKGTILHFGKNGYYHNWNHILDYFILKGEFDAKHTRHYS